MPKQSKKPSVSKNVKHRDDKTKATRKVKHREPTSSSAPKSDGSSATAASSASPAPTAASDPAPVPEDKKAAAAAEDPRRIHLDQNEDGTVNVTCDFCSAEMAKAANMDAALVLRDEHLKHSGKLVAPEATQFTEPGPTDRER